MENKLSIAERIPLTLRAYSVIKKYCPGLMSTIIIKALVTALQPFATIWFSAQILDEIAGDGNLQKLTILAISVIMINFLISVIKGRIDIFHSERENQMWCYFSKIFADKQLSMDYADIENVNIQKRKTKEKENLFNFGNGLAQFVWTINGMIEGTASIIVSIAMVVTLFTSKSGNSLMDSPIWFFTIAFVIFVGLFINAKIFEKNNIQFMAWCEQFAPFNRLFSFFGFILVKDSDKAKDVRIYRQDVLADITLHKLEERDKSDKSYYFKSNLNEAIAAGIIGLNHVVCYLFVALKAFFGAFGVGSVVQYVGALGRLGDGLQKLIFGITDNAVYTVHLKSLFEFLDLPNKKYQGTLPIEKRTDNEYEIEFHQVSFRYPGSENYALKNLNLKLKIGQKLAVVGVNGSGKTTMIKLICRLYDPTDGEITLNGVDIKKYRYEEYMDIFSVVFQDFKLFSLPLDQNIAASIAVEKKRATEALETVGFGEHFSALLRGLDTLLYKDFAEDGVDISGGEAQKLALARALYKNAPIVVLDEPTAALDPIAEFELYSKFNKIVEGRTAIYISHRLASCRFCDDIAVFHEGALVQRGSHADLLGNKDGQYYKLWNAQAQYYAQQ